MKPAVSLKVMAEDKENEGVSKVTRFDVDPRLVELDAEGVNRPIDHEHVAKLSIAYEHGATFPALDVRVDQGRIIVVDGQHRALAAKAAIERGAPVVALECRHFRGDDADRAAHICTSAGGLQLDPLFRAEKYKELRHFGWSEQKIADRVGESISHVRNHLALIDANTDVKQAVAAGEVSATNAVKLVKEHGSKAGEVIQDAVQQARLEGKKKATAKQINGGTPKTLLGAIRAEMESGGKFRAEDLCPAYAAEIAYLRGTAVMKAAA